MCILNPKKTLAKKAEKALIKELPVDEKALRRAAWLLEPKHIKQLGLLAVGGTALVSLLGDVRRTRMIRKAMSRELKKQLAQVNKKLDELEKQNEELRRQNAELQKRLAH